MMKSLRKTAVGLLTACVLLQVNTHTAAAQEQEQYDPDVPEPTFSEVRYGEHERQVLDFWRAASSDGPTPLVFVIHGGAWKVGSKERAQRFADVPALLEAGISVVAINYRYITQAQAAGVQPPVQWPLEDAARALQFVRTMSDEWGFDPERIGAAGGSAGACSSLWLAYHDDMAEPDSADPVARESTRLYCAAVLGAQTSLDPAQMQAWIPNITYGAQAMGFGSFQAFHDARERIRPWIAEYSPYASVSADDPPVYIEYTSPPAVGQNQRNATHSANFGVMLQRRCAELGVSCEVTYPGAPGVTHESATAYLISVLTQRADTP